MILLIHGFNVSDHGENSVGKLRDILRENGHKALVLQYGWLGLMGVRVKNDDIAREFSRSVDPDDTLIGHSNGCEIIHQMAEMGTQFRKALMFNPAVAPDRRIPPEHSCMETHIFHDPGDQAIYMAGLIRRMSPLNLFKKHAWGEQGRIGYVGPTDSRITNHRMHNKGYFKHSAVFSRDNLENILPEILEIL